MFLVLNAKDDYMTSSITNLKLSSTTGNPVTLVATRLSRARHEMKRLAKWMSQLSYFHTRGGKNEQKFDSNTLVDCSRGPYNMQVLFSSHKVTYGVDSLSRLKGKK